MSDDIALINTVDFFPPIVDDPYMFGQIAAANSLSDVYAMGGEPKLAMNLLTFPNGKLPLDAVKAILEGGNEEVTALMIKNRNTACPLQVLLILMTS